jgi:hypothetical protein
MGMLARYHKTGGFLQLLQLIETCGKQKQDNFLNMIQTEDQNWSKAILEKMLTIDKILTWDSSVLGEIAARLQDLTLAIAMHGFKPEDCTKLLQTFSHSQRRMIEDLKSSKTPTPAELSSAYVKIITEVRNMLIHGYLRPEKFAPELAIPDGIEEKLGKSSAATETNTEVPNLDGFGSSQAPQAAPAQSGAGLADVHELNSLRSRVQNLIKENHDLKNQVRVMNDKLTQIKKIA